MSLQDYLDSRYGKSKSKKKDKSLKQRPKSSIQKPTKPTKLENATLYRDLSGNVLSHEEMLEQQRQKSQQEKQKANEEAEKLRNMNLPEVTQTVTKRVAPPSYVDDPLLAFSPDKVKSLQRDRYVSQTGRKLYRSSFPDNRFSILPGYRWDGIDRSNGWEQKVFKTTALRQEKKVLSYTMQDDY
ncbi:BA75_00461T0 [Komagataella pastoris]|uniref:Pre-mRNA-splicing factor CWC26 n=1 Tax=Komagataella pastoris TaxID=4922 RepID=A0A1B2J9A4_PICPA|nr:BA75_00461T0 [Komagataella pastoris]